jgi:hypothetical protein
VIVAFGERYVDLAETTPQSTTVALRCLGCERSATDEASGWKAYIGGGYEGDPIEVGVFCPDCAAREFGDS